MNVTEFLKTIGAFFNSKGITEVEQISQALSVGNIWDKAYGALYMLEDVDYPYIMEIMQDASETYIIYTDEGSLYKVPYSVSQNDEIELGSVTKVKMEFIEVPQTSSFEIFRTTDGDYKFVSISACAVINRVGEIDSNQLFDKFVERFDEDNKPYVTFYHLGKGLQFGHVEQIFHYENFLVSMGVLYQDNIFTEAAIDKFPSGEWGVSPAFYVYETKKEQIGGVEVPVYTDGEMFELSVCRETHAANYFTKIQGVKNRFIMTKNERNKYEGFIKDFIGEEKADDALKVLDQIEQLNQVIDEEKMIYRTNEEEEIVVEETELEIDDEVIDQIAERVNTSLNERFEAFGVLIEQITASVSSLTEAQASLQTLVVERVEQVEKEDDEKIAEKVQDLPKAKLKVGYRTRQPENQENALGIDYDGNGNIVVDAKALRERAKAQTGERK